MTIENALKMIFEQGTENYNSGTFDAFEDILSQHVQFFCPEIKTAHFFTEEVSLTDRKDVIVFFKSLGGKSKPQISKFEYLKIGKVSKVRCYYESMDFILDKSLHFDEYGKVFKLINEQVFI